MSKRARNLEEFLNSPNSFNYVQLTGKNITDQDCARVAAAIKNNTTVTTFYIYGTSVGDVGASSLADALKVNTTITGVNLQQNQIGDVGASSLAGALKINNIVTYVSLNQNQIGDVGASSLADALKVNTAITQVNLQQNQIGDVGASSLADALKVNKTITLLNFYQNQIGDVGASNLADALKGNKTLTYIHLQQNQIGDVGASSLADALKVNKVLQYVILNQNQIEDMGAGALANCLKLNTKLTYLYLENNKISAQTCKDIKGSWDNRNNQCLLGSQNQPVAPQVGGVGNLPAVDQFANDCVKIAFNNDQKTLADWLGSNFDPTRVDNNGRTLLWHATIFNNTEVAKLLLDSPKGLSCIKIADKDGYTPVKIALLLKKDDITNLAVNKLASYVHSGQDFDREVAGLLLPSMSEPIKQSFLHCLEKVADLQAQLKQAQRQVEKIQGSLTGKGESLEEAGAAALANDNLLHGDLSSSVHKEGSHESEPLVKLGGAADDYAEV